MRKDYPAAPPSGSGRIRLIKRGSNAYVRMPRRQVLAISLMFSAARHRTLTSMSETSWSNPDIGFDMSALPTGTVTLLLADVEGSTRLWETQPEAMKSAVERLDRTFPTWSSPTAVCGPSSRARATASSSRSPAPRTQWPVRSTCSAPRWRLSSCVSACIPATYICATKATTSGRRSTAPLGCATSATAVRRCYLVRRNPLSSTSSRPTPRSTDLGSHPLRDLPRPERVVQLCHPDLHNDFPPLRTAPSACHGTSSSSADEFIGRQAEMRGHPHRHWGQPTGHTDGRGRRGQDAAGRSGRRRYRHRVRRRRLVCRPGAGHRSRRGTGDGGTRAGPPRPARPADDGRAAAGSSAIARC